MAKKDESGGLMGKAMEMMFPLLVAGVGWLLTQIAGFNNRLIQIEAKMPSLITPEGIVIDSPQSAAARAIMKQDLIDRIQDLQVRVKLLEQEVDKK